MERFVVIRDGQVVSTISWGGDEAPEGLPPGISLMRESDAVLQGIPRAVPGGKPELLARAAIQSDFANVAQDRAIAGAAQAVANGSGAMTNVQLTTAVRQMAAALVTLARNDAMANRQRIALILRGLADFDPVGANTATGDVTAVPGDATAATPPARPGSSSERAAVPGNAVADAAPAAVSTP